MSSPCGDSSLNPVENGVISLCFLEVILYPLAFLFLVVLGLYRIFDLLKREHNGSDLRAFLLEAFGSSWEIPLQRTKVSLSVVSSIIPFLSLLLKSLVTAIQPYEVFSATFQCISWLIATLMILVEFSQASRNTWVLRSYVCVVFILKGTYCSFLVAKDLPISLILLECIDATICGVLACILLFYNRIDNREYQDLQQESPVGQTPNGTEHGNHTTTSISNFTKGVSVTTRQPLPRSYHNLWGRLTFSWLSGLLYTGYKRPLELGDMFEPTRDLQSHLLTQQLEDYWESEKMKPKYGSHQIDLTCSPSLWKPMLKVIWKQMVISFVLRAGQDLLSLVNPNLLRMIIQFIQSPEEPISKGLLLVVAMCISIFVQTQFTQHYFNTALQAGLRIKMALVGTVYRKSFRLSNKSRQGSTVGEIVNLQAIDAQRFAEVFHHMQLMFSTVFVMVFVLIMLWNVMGPSSLAGVALIVIAVPLNSWCVRKTTKLQQANMKLRDSRMKVMNELLNGIRIIKFFAWEDNFSEKITQIRSNELKNMRAAMIVRSMMVFFLAALPVLVGVVVFSVYAISGGELTAEKAFTSLAFFNVLRLPMNLLPMALSSILECRVAVQRITKFLNLEEINPKDVTYKPKESNSSLFAVTMQEASFSWDSSESVPFLNNINLNIPTGKLVCIVGSVGSGKSSLLSAILGEIPRTNGSVTVYGSTGYVAQQAWIQNVSLRQNILFGKDLNKDKYEEILRVCELNSDIDILPSGDHTEIGEKGINLSGGQKQRISLARAVYQDCDIYLLDDCLSAVDAHVGKTIFNECICKMLSNKTRILVTHQLQYVHQADLIVYVQDGTVLETGTYETLMAKQEHFHKLITSNLKLEVMDESQEMEPSQNNNVTPKPQKKEGKEGKGKIMLSEERETGNVSVDVYKKYFIACGGTITVAMILIFYSMETSFKLSSEFWLSRWANGNGERTTYYGTIYALLASTCVVLVFVRSVAIFRAGIKASKSFHESMLDTILHCPTTYFDGTPVGRILNRFSKDIQSIDDTLPRIYVVTLQVLFGLINAAALFCIVFPVFITVLLPLGYFYRYLQKYYLQSSRELQRLESISRSPIFAQFSETLNGLQTIRPYKRQVDFIHLNYEKCDVNAGISFLILAANRWLGLRLDFISNSIITLMCTFCVVQRASISPGIAGLCISYALVLTQTLNWFVRQQADLESNMVSVERAVQYSNLPQEAPHKLSHMTPRRKADSYIPLTDAASWPDFGEIVFQNVKLRYREGLDLVLHGISLKIAPCQKVGIVGRTGAGKSSMLLALFRLVELAEGKILIDGIDISTIGLKDLRSKLSIIPQDPILFTGTVRANLDPFQQYSDNDIWSSLEAVSLKETIQNLSAKLESQVVEGGENFSVGQRQLLCLARALLKRTRILVLDEATAAVDFETDKLIQRTIRQQFNQVSVLTIAHRINTVMDYDKILVLDQGLVAEYDSPAVLLKNPNGIFTSLAQNSSSIMSEQTIQ